LGRLVIDQEKHTILRRQKSLEADFRERWHHVFLSMNECSLALTRTSREQNLFRFLRQKVFRHTPRRLNRSSRLIDPPADMKRALFELDAIGLAAAQEFDGILVDERHVPQIQNHLLPTCFGGEQLLELLDILFCLNPAAECEQDLAISRSPSS
jgi:hypothetical protein